MNIPKEQMIAQDVGGEKLGNILSDLLDYARPGVNVVDIEKRATEEIKKAGGTPSFHTVEDYRWATCICVNDVVVHGIPVTQTLKEEDILTIDIGMLYNGYHTDTAWTKIITSGGQEYLEKQAFLQAGETALAASIAQAKVGNHIGHISQAIQEHITGCGYSIIKSLVGHTIGKKLHEKPQVPGYLRGEIEATPRIFEGMTIAIEVIYAQGKGDIVYANEDGWTIATKDHSLSAVFEHTVRVEANGAKVLTERKK